MRHTQGLSVYLRQYRLVPLLLQRPYDSFIGEQVLNHILDRDAMEGNREVTAALVAADRSLSSALSAADRVWWEHLQDWAAQCGFAKSPWWLSAQYNARRDSDTPLSLVDLLGSSADAWIKAFGDGIPASEKPVRVDSIVASFHQALLVGVAQDHGIVSERVRRGRMLPPALARFAQASPTIVVPGSVMVGFQLPRKNPAEPASGPAEESLAALNVVLRASDRYSPDGDPDLIADVVEDQAQCQQMWKSLGGIYNAAGPGAERIEISAGRRGTERTVTWQVHGKARRRPRKVRSETLIGNVRAIDLDRSSLRVRRDGAQWCTAVRVKPSLFVRVSDLAGLVIGRDVVVNGTTADDADPPRVLIAIDINPVE